MSTSTATDLVEQIQRSDLGAADLDGLRLAAAQEQGQRALRAYIDRREAEGVDRALVLAYWLTGRPADALEGLEVLASTASVNYFLQGLIALHTWDRRHLAWEYFAQAEAKARDADLFTIQVQKVEAMLHVFGRERLAEAEQALAPLIKQESDAPDVRCLRAWVRELRGEPEEALDEYQAILRIHSTNVRTLFRAAHLADRVGEDALALRWYEALVTLNPSYTGALVNLGTLYEDYGRWDDARRIYQAILDVLPGHRWARMFLTDADASQHQYYDEEREHKEDKFEKILKIPVTDFELSVRSRNCLTRMQIHTLGDLIKKTEADLLSYKNFGETSLQEIKTVLTQKGLRLGLRKEEEEQRYKSETERILAAQGNSKLLDKPITELKLGIRARKGMEKLGLRTLGDLVGKTPTDLLALRNFGQTSLVEIRKKLAEYGLKLKET